MKILALDFATKTGWAADGISGVQVFDVKRGESPGMRFLRFRAWLRELCNELVHPDVIAYEQPHHRGGAATEVAYGFLTEVKTRAARQNIELMPVHSSTLKKWAVGKGNAGKGEMMFEARRRGYSPADDNEADACLLFEYARSDLTGDGTRRNIRVNNNERGATMSEQQALYRTRLSEERRKNRFKASMLIRQMFLDGEVPDEAAPMLLMAAYELENDGEENERQHQ